MVVVRAPRQEDGDPDYAPCECELEDCEDTYGLLTHPKECPDCGGEFTDEDIAALQKQAKDAIDNYEPSERQLQDMMDGPSLAERTELANRNYWRLKR